MLNGSTCSEVLSLLQFAINQQSIFSWTTAFIKASKFPHIPVKSETCFHTNSTTSLHYTNKTSGICWRNQPLSWDLLLCTMKLPYYGFGPVLSSAGSSAPEHFPLYLNTTRQDLHKTKGFSTVSLLTKLSLPAMKDQLVLLQTQFNSAGVSQKSRGSACVLSFSNHERRD